VIIPDVHNELARPHFVEINKQNILSHAQLVDECPVNPCRVAPVAQAEELDLVLDLGRVDAA